MFPFVKKLETPQGTKSTPKIMSEKKQNLKSNNKKRKSLPANINGSNDITPKKPKLEPFTGTSDLFKQTKSPEDSKVTKVGKSPKKSNLKNKPAKDNATNDTVQTPSKELKKGKRTEKIRARRAAAKDKLKKTIADAKSGNMESVTLVKTKIAEMESKGKLSNSSKRKLRLLKKILNDDEVKDTKPVQTSNKAGKKEQNVLKQKKMPKTKNKQPENKIQVEKEEENEDSTGDSDDIGEEILKKEISTKNIKDKSELIKPEIVAEEESDSGDEEEDEDESENDADNLIEDESIDDEEEVEGDSDEDSVEEEEDDDDEQEDDEGEEDDEKEQDDSDDEVIKNTDNQKFNKKEQYNVPQKQDSLKVHSSPGDQSQLSLFVGNLPYDATQEEIAEHFSEVGNIKEIRIPLDRNTNRPRGFAYVELLNQASYEKALTLDQSVLKGRKINVRNSEKKNPNMRSPFMQRGGRSFGNNSPNMGAPQMQQRGRGRSFGNSPNMRSPQQGGRPFGNNRGSPRGRGRGRGRGGPGRTPNMNWN